MNSLMINRTIYLIVFVLIMCSFKQPQYCKDAAKIIRKYSKQMRIENSLYLCGSGGAMMDDIKEVNTHFISYDCLDVDSARRLYIEAAEDLLSRFNSNEKVRPYLHDYPFTYKNLRLMIGLEDKKRNHRADGYVALMFLSKKKDILFEGYDPETQSFYTIHREPYEEALRIVNEQSCNR